MDPERIESVKAGIVAAIAGILVSLILVAVDILVAAGSLADTLLIILQRLSIAAVCCFLFGVTYRYIIRQDPNPHLRSGAVGAFALTRSLSQLESIDLETSGVLPLSIPIFESFGLFLMVRLVLDLGLKQRWLKPFTSVPGSEH
ncbi:MAG: hypothetical protein KTR27_05020 [Leptolyngbyaceae cyanobacterium MAG.088]|nr:hypothetical protein [Leptolyngbyaceae cyanobacterium MAG.088]